MILPSTTILLSIGQYVIAMLIGIGFYYVMSQQEEKKQRIDMVTSYIINFVLYIWLAKIIILLPLFVKDPFAVLPYPSDSRMFYLATILTIVHGWINWKRKKLVIKKFVEAFIPIFFMGSFIYEFFEIVWNHFGQSWYTIGLYAILLIIYIFTKIKNPLLYIGTWAFVQSLYGFIFPYTTLFGYTLSAYYFIIIWMIVVMMWIRRSR